ncbi:hypothetical protein FGW20_02115 [Methanoculleus sp. FWC-SCC3]|uniref:Uncharacterized protein n=1 Tax=Methanoculleus methanifontis TaxID=2584086 RepID=A0ABT8LYX2_9EURY|nr:hypothetical protein [Methanoculleus sp. FWC-SCC3]
MEESRSYQSVCYQLLRALSVPVTVLAFFPLLVIVSLVPIAIVPDPRALIGVGYAAALTLSFVYFGLKLRKIGEW